jgi:hypothetical protein
VSFSLSKKTSELGKGFPGLPVYRHGFLGVLVLFTESLFGKEGVVHFFFLIFMAK